MLLARRSPGGNKERRKKKLAKKRKKKEDKVDRAGIGCPSRLFDPRFRPGALTGKKKEKTRDNAVSFGLAAVNLCRLERGEERKKKKYFSKKKKKRKGRSRSASTALYPSFSFNLEVLAWAHRRQRKGEVRGRERETKKGGHLRLDLSFGDDFVDPHGEKERKGFTERRNSILTSEPLPARAKDEKKRKKASTKKKKTGVRAYTQLSPFARMGKMKKERKGSADRGSALFLSPFVLVTPPRREKKNVREGKKKKGAKRGGGADHLFPFLDGACPPIEKKKKPCLSLFILPREKLLKKG